jgi:hypothetical protein
LAVGEKYPAVRIAGPGRSLPRLRSPKAEGPVLSDDARQLRQDLMRLGARHAARVIRRCVGDLVREARDVHRNDLHPNGRPQRVDAERAQVFVEVPPLGRQDDCLDPGLVRPVDRARYATVALPRRVCSN